VNDDPLPEHLALDIVVVSLDRHRIASDRRHGALSYNHGTLSRLGTHYISSLLPKHIISASCEEDLAKYGDSFRGAGYTKSPQQAAERYALMLDVVRERNTPSHSAYRQLRYVGLDISLSYLAAAQERHLQSEFILMDVLAADEALPTFDYVVMNGVFNYKGSIEYDRMLEYWEQSS
jgi:hypothetical protein